QCDFSKQISGRTNPVGALLAAPWQQTEMLGGQPRPRRGKQRPYGATNYKTYDRLAANAALAHHQQDAIRLNVMPRFLLPASFSGSVAALFLRPALARPQRSGSEPS